MRESDAQVAAFLGAAGLQATPTEYDRKENPTAWALPGRLFLVDARTTFNGHRLYRVTWVKPGGSGSTALTKDVGLPEAVEIAAVFSLPPRGRTDAH